MNLIVLHNDKAHYALSSLFYTLPETVVLKNGKPLFLPDELRPASLCLHLAVRISNLGRTISERFAHRYYDALSVVPQFYSSSLLNEAQEKGFPWSSATEFDGAVPMGGWHIITGALSPQTLRLEIDEQVAVEQTLFNMSHNIDRTIAHISKRHTLRRGDVLLMGACTASFEIDINHRVAAFLNEEKLLTFNVK